MLKMLSEKVGCNTVIYSTVAKKSVKWCFVYGEVSF